MGLVHRKPSQNDKDAMVKANRLAQGIEDETDFENAVIGAFILARHRYIDENFYTTDFTRDVDHMITLDRASEARA